ncbi:uncharacterized protein LOC130015353 isoform X1 [Mercurialis annua]|uniref:uncharacterized protein LOC130015353 isoform X1 n=1 Tax=Mercurialis annua TaxID=3986 RepID=UPI0024AD818E|nr:uncharacterized protein LOC130015353 isoform X1 [Mercurialis annua]
MLVHYGLSLFINELKHRISFRTNYLETHPQWAGVVESSPISTLKVLRYNGLHELLKCLESQIALSNTCGRRDVPIQPHKCRRLETSREFRGIGTVTSPLPLNRMIGAFNLLSFHGPYPSNPRPSALALVAPHTAGDHGEHVAGGGVPIQLAAVPTKPAAACGNITFG